MPGLMTRIQSDRTFHSLTLGYSGSDCNFLEHGPVRPVIFYHSLKPNQLGERAWSFPLTPIDCLYRAFYDRATFTNRDWDLVLVGVNYGANLGFDIFHSGTCGVAMVAATQFGCPSIAFSQDLPSEQPILPTRNVKEEARRAYFSISETVLPDFLRKNQVLAPSVCLNVNIPEKEFFGYKEAMAAHYSYHRLPPTSIVPRAGDEKSDVTYLMQGYVTVTNLKLRVNPVLRN